MSYKCAQETKWEKIYTPLVGHTFYCIIKIYGKSEEKLEKKNVDIKDKEPNSILIET